MLFRSGNRSSAGRNLPNKKFLKAWAERELENIRVVKKIEKKRLDRIERIRPAKLQEHDSDWMIAHPWFLFGHALETLPKLHKLPALYSSTILSTSCTAFPLPSTPV